MRVLSGDDVPKATLDSIAASASSRCCRQAHRKREQTMEKNFSIINPRQVKFIHCHMHRSGVVINGHFLQNERLQVSYW
jgi:hypothetical protein